MSSIIPQSYPLHKGFVPGKNQAGCEKQPAMKFTEQYFHSFEELQDSPNVLGILNDDIVMIDTDTKEDTEAFIRILQHLRLTVPYVQTTKGMHFYFKDSSIQSAQTAVMLCCGIVVDIKLGNRHGLDLLRMNGQNRNCGYFDQPLMPVPFWAQPIKDSVRCNLQTLAGLGKGSRNHQLFTMVGRIKRAGLTYEQCVDTINIINENVISSPLPKHEVNLLCRKDGYNNSVTGGSMPNQIIQHTNGADLPARMNYNTPAPFQQPVANDEESVKFNHNEAAVELVERFNLKTIDGQPYVYKDGEYRNVSDFEFEKLVNTVVPESTQRQRTEVKLKSLIICPAINTEETEANRKYINFANGLFNIEDNSITPHNPNYFVPNLIPHAISTEPMDCPELDNFVSQIASDNPDTINQIYEMAGLCLYRRNFVRGCYILIGPRANGKSTFLNFLSYCLGRDNTASMKLHQLSERFNTQIIDCKLANLGDDISDAYISDSSTLKSIITSDTMLVDVKNKKPYMMTPYATLIFSANTMPRATDATKALLDRMVIVPFTAQFTADNGNLNTDMAATLHKPEIASEFLRRAVIALQRVRHTKTLTVGAVSEEVKREYEIENNSVLSFITDSAGIGDNVDVAINRIPLVDVYVRYVDYCRVAGLVSMSRNAFSRYLKHQLINAEKKAVFVDNKTVNAFTRIDPDTEISVAM